MNKNDDKISTGQILLMGVFFLASVMIIFNKNNSEYTPTDFLTAYTPPCDIYPNSGETDDWCQKYIDWGYANGAVMAARVLGECEFLKNEPFNSKEDCDPRKIIQELYDENHHQSIDEEFPTANRDDNGNYMKIYY